MKRGSTWDILAALTHLRTVADVKRHQWGSPEELKRSVTYAGLIAVAHGEPAQRIQRAKGLARYPFVSPSRNVELLRIGITTVHARNVVNVAIEIQELLLCPPRQRSAQ